MQAEQGLTDVWRLHNPQAMEYTRTTHSANHVVFSGRTTRWLISQEVLDAQWLASCAHLYGQVPGDHAAAAVELKPPQEPLVGKRSWVFPTYLLGVQEFLEHMTTHIHDYLAQLMNGLGAMDLWSDLKVSIKLCTLAYCYSRAADRRRERGELEQALHATRVAFQNNPASSVVASNMQQAIKALQQHDDTVLKPVPGSGSRANCAQFHGSSDAKHVSSWFQPWATLWPTCHMLVPASFLLNV